MLHDDSKIFVFAVSSKFSANNVWFCLAFGKIEREKIIRRVHVHGFIIVPFNQRENYWLRASEMSMSWHG